MRKRKHKKAPTVPATNTKPALKVSEMAVARAATPGGSALDARMGIFAPPEFPKAARPPRQHQLAMDSSLTDFGSWAWGLMSSRSMEGLTFMGFPALSELSQRGEYRRIVEQLAHHMTRRWIRLVSTSGDEKKADRIKELEKELKRLKAQQVIKRALEHDGFFGRGHIFIDLGTNDRPNELAKPIGDADSAKYKVSKGSLKALRVVEPLWTYPQEYDAQDPLNENWYRPEKWYVMRRAVHRTRLLTIVSREVPDTLKPAYAFGGLPMTQMARPYVDNWLRIRQAVTDLVTGFSQFVLMTDLLAQLSSDQSSEELYKRLKVFADMRSNKGIMAVDKEREDLKNVSAPIGGLHELQAQAQEHMSSISGIPILFLLGDQPTGLNASSEGAIRAFYDWVHSGQENNVGPVLDVLLPLAQLNLWGKIDDDITYEFVNLWTPTETERATNRKSEADRDAAYINAGVVAPDEVRERLGKDPESGYTLDLERDDIQPPGEPAPGEEGGPPGSEGDGEPQE